MTSTNNCTLVLDVTFPEITQSLFTSAMERIQGVNAITYPHCILVSGIDAKKATDNKATIDVLEHLRRIVLDETSFGNNAWIARAVTTNHGTLLVLLPEPHTKAQTIIHQFLSVPLSDILEANMSPKESAILGIIPVATVATMEDATRIADTINKDAQDIRVQASSIRLVDKTNTVQITYPVSTHKPTWY